jgi:ElaB/YqjD/DUF883 family membrane-anchored ribosome-binding protein
MKTEQETPMNTTDKIAGYAHETIDTVANATNQATEAFADVTQQARESFDEKSDQFINAEQRMVKECRSYVRDNPVTSLGIAVAGGFLLSRLLSGR